MGCDLPPIPLEPLDLDVPDVPDMRAEDSSPDVARLCEPNSTGCFGPSQAFVCDRTGLLLSLTQCHEEARCEAGRCEVIQDTCAPGELLRLTPGELQFETSPDLKRQTAQVNVSNCSTRPARLLVARVEDTPVHEDGQPVFAFDTISPQGLELPPGESFNVKLVYHPRGPNYQDQARLRLQAQGVTTAVQQVALTTRALCVSAAPRVELGVFVRGEAAGALWPLTNCGSVPLVLSAVELVPHDEGQELPDVQLVDAQGRPLTGRMLEPGEVIEGWLLVRKQEVGPLDATAVVLASAATLGNAPLSQRPLASARVSGFSRASLAAGCKPGQTPELEVVGAVQREGTIWQVEPLLPLVLRPVEQTWPWLHYTASAGRIPVRSLRHQGALTLVPEHVGALTLRAQAFEADGVPRCEVREVALDVRPTAPLYAELSWQADNDVILDDEGQALGVDLDLYANLGVEQGASWRDASQSCGASLIKETPALCAGERIFLLSTSESGAQVEALRVEVPSRVELGIWLAARHRWKGEQATLRVWRFGVEDNAVAQLNPIQLGSQPAFYYAAICEPANAQCTRVGNTRSWLD
jgi:hypothetical protein